MEAFDALADGKNELIRKSRRETDETKRWGKLESPLTAPKRTQRSNTWNWTELNQILLLASMSKKLLANSSGDCDAGVRWERDDNAGRAGRHTKKLIILGFSICVSAVTLEEY